MRRTPVDPDAPGRRNRFHAPPRLRAQGPWAQLRGLSAADVEVLEELASSTEFAAGDVLVEATANPAETPLLWVEAGEVAVSDVLRNGYLGLPVYVPEGAVVGERALAPEVAPRVEVRAASDVRVSRLSPEALRAAAARVPGLRPACRELGHLRRHRVEMIRALRHLPTFAQGSVSALLPLATATTLRALAPGETLYTEGSAAAGIYYVARGQLVLTEGAAGRRLGTRHEGQFLGALGQRGGGSETETARAQVPTEVLVVPAEALVQRLAVSGGFRRAAGGVALVTASGESVFASEFTQVLAMRSEQVVHTGNALHLLGRYLAERHGDDVIVVHVDPHASASPAVPTPNDDGTFASVRLPLVLGRDPATVLRNFVSRLHGYEYCLVDVPRAAGWVEALDDTVSRWLYLARDTLARTPRELALRRVTWCADLKRDGRDTGPADRPGAVRLDLGFCEHVDVDTPLAALPTEHLDTLGRWARAVAERRVGIGLGGGGAWGFAHIPLLRRIHQAGVPIDLVAGASFGALAGAFWCAQGVAGLERLLALGEQARNAAFKGAISSRAMATFVDGALGSCHMAQLPVPFLAVATDVNRCRQAIITSGSVGEAVRASSAFPAVTTPVLGPGFRHVDGGIIQNVPVDALVVQRADLVIASNIVAKPEPRREGGYRTRLLDAARRVAPGLVDWAREFNPIGRFDDLKRSALILMHTAGDTGSWSADTRFESVPSQHGIGAFAHGREIAAENEEAAEVFVEELKQRWEELRRGRGRAG